VLLRTLGNAAVQPLNPLLPARCRQQPCDALFTPVRMGGAIFVAAWSELSRAGLHSFARCSETSTASSTWSSSLRSFRSGPSSSARSSLPSSRMRT
jgi:hypothetical protein